MLPTPKVTFSQAGKTKWRFTENKWISSYTYVENVSHAHILAAERLSDAKDIAAGKAYQINDGDTGLFWGRLYEVCEAGGVPRSELGAYRIPLPTGLIYAIAYVFWTIGVPLGNFIPRNLALMTTHHYYSIELAKNELGYGPVMRPSQSWKLTLDYFHEWAKKNVPPRERRSSSTLFFLLGIISVALLAYFSRARWVGVFDILK